MADQDVPKQSQELAKATRRGEQEIRSLVRASHACLLGTLDKNGRQIIVIPHYKGVSTELSAALSFITQLFSEDVQKKGFTIIVDARNEKWTNFKSILPVIKETLSYHVAAVLILRPDAFWERRKSGRFSKHDLTAYPFDTILLSSLAKLEQYVEKSQLPENFGGTYNFNPQPWIDRRIEVDKLLESVPKIGETLNQLKQQIEDDDEMPMPSPDELEKQKFQFESKVKDVADLLEKGRQLLEEIRNDSSVDISEELQDVSLLDERITSLNEEYLQIVENWERRNETLLIDQSVASFKRDSKQVIEWLCGPGEEYLLKNIKLGNSLTSAEALMKKHEEFEAKTKGIIGSFATARAKAKHLLQSQHPKSSEIQEQKTTMDKYCRNFAFRMERRQFLLLSSMNFHSWTQVASRHLDDLLSVLCTDVDDTLEEEATLNMLESTDIHTKGIAEATEATLHEGYAILEALKTPLTDVYGKEVDYECGSIAGHIRNTIDDLVERKKRNDELCDVRKLKLQQILQLRSCEKDTDQAVAWLKELCDVMMASYTNVGRTYEEAGRLKTDHEKFQSTAKGTYDYGEQVVQAALVLRRSCRFALTPVHDREEMLAKVWEQVVEMIIERGKRLEAAVEFYKNSEKFLHDVDELAMAYVQEGDLCHLSKEQVSTEMIIHSDIRERVTKDCQVTVTFGENFLKSVVLPLTNKDATTVGSESAEDTTSCPPVAECLAEVKERKVEWEEMWNERLNKLQKLADGEAQAEHSTSEIVQWVKDINCEVGLSLFNIGDNLNEAQTLSYQCSMVERAVTRKSDQVKEALAVFRSLSNSGSGAISNAAMADSLDESWKDLNTQLETRRILLDTSVAFHRSAEEFSQRISLVEEQLGQTLLAGDVTVSKALMQEHQELRRSLLELSMQTLSKGQLLLDRLREASSHADINNRHATKAACFSIERTLETLSHRRRKLDELWKSRRKTLEQCVRKCRVQDETEKLCSWLKNEGEEYLGQTNNGDTVESIEILLRQHFEFENEVEGKEEIIHKLVRSSQKLIHVHHPEGEPLHDKVMAVKLEFKQFRKRVNERKENLKKHLSFCERGKETLEKLKQIEEQIKNKSRQHVGKDEDILGEISRVSAYQIREGQLLSDHDKDEREPSAASQIYDELRSSYANIVEHVTSSSEDADREYKEMYLWAKNVGESFLAQNTGMGDNGDAVEEFVTQHESLRSETEKMQEKCQSIIDAGRNLDVNSNEEEKDLSNILSALGKRVDYRIEIGKQYACFCRQAHQLVAKIDNLEEQLTSEEPKENVDASQSTILQQQQRRESIISSSAKTQKLGQSLLDELKREESEDSLDREHPADTIRKFLRQFEERNLHLDEIWDARSEQLERNKILNKHFGQFEKDTREVISWIQNQSEEFFQVDLNTNLFSMNTKELNKRLEKYKTSAKIAEEAVKQHLDAAESLVFVESGEQAALRIVTDELKIVYERFKTCLADYEVFLSMCSTFYQSVERLTQLLNQMVVNFSSSKSTSDLTKAQLMLQDHLASYDTVLDQYNFTVRCGHDILTKCENDAAVSVSREQIKRYVDQAESHKEEWLSLWEHHKTKLEESIKLCEFEQRINQVNIEIEEHNRALLALNNKYGESLMESVSLLKDSDLFLESVKPCDVAVNELMTEADALVREKHHDAVNIQRKVSAVEKRWQRFLTNVEEYRGLLEAAVEFYQLYEQSETWLTDSEHFVNTTRTDVKQCRSVDEIMNQHQNLVEFVKPGCERQDSRVLKLGELASKIGVEQQRKQVRDLVTKHKRILLLFKRLEQKLRRMADEVRLCEAEGREIQFEMSSPEGSDDEILLSDINDSSLPDLSCESAFSFTTASGQPVVMTVDRVSGFKRKSDENLEESLEYGKRPQVIVSVQSERSIGPDVERQMGPIVESEIQRWMPEDGEGTQEREVVLRIQDQIQESFPEFWISEGNEVVKIELGPTVTEGPIFRQHVEVETNLAVETSPKVLTSDEAGEKTEFTRKRTWETTTRETTTSVKKEIRTELEVFVVEKSRRIENYIPEDEPSPERLDIQVKSSTVLPDNKPAQASEPEGSDQHTELVIVEGQIREPVALDETRKEIQQSNEKICLKIEHALGHKGRHDVSPSDQELSVPRNAGTVSVFRTPPATPEPVPEVISPSTTQDEVFISPRTDTSELFFESQPKLNPVEIKVHLPDSADQQEHAHGKFNEILDDLIESEKNYVKSLAHVQKYMAEVKDSSELSPDAKEAIFMNIDEIEEFHKTFVIDLENCQKTPSSVGTTFVNSKNELQRYLTFREKKPESDLVLLSVPTTFFQKLLSKIHIPSLESLLEEPIKRIYEYRTYLTQLVQYSEYLPDDSTELKEAKKIIDAIVTRMENPSCEVSDLDIPNKKQPVTMNFSARSPDEISVKRGDLVTILNLPTKSDDQVYVMKFPGDGSEDCKGLIPKYILDTEEQEVKEPTNQDKSPIEALDKTPASFPEQTIQIAQDEPLESFLPNGEQDLPSIEQPAFKPVTISIPLPDDTVQLEDSHLYIEPVSFLKPLKSVDATEGDDVTFDCVISGSPPLGIQWYKDKNSVPNDDPKYTMGAKQNKLTLIVKDVGPDDVGDYRCTIGNDRSLASSDARLDVKANPTTWSPPEFAKVPQDVVSVEGNTVKFEAKVSGNPTPEIIWLKDNKPIQPSARCQIQDENGLHSLIITNCTPEDSAEYTLEARNDAGLATCPFTLSLNDDNVPPKFTRKLHDTTLPTGSPLHFTTSFVGTPEPEVTWFVDDKPLVTTSGCQVVTKEGTSTLLIGQLEQEDAGNYKCVARNSVGKATSGCSLVVEDAMPDSTTETSQPGKSIEIPVIMVDLESKEDKNSTNIEEQVAPRFIKPLNNIQVLENETVKFEVVLEGSPKPSVRWEFEGKPLEENDCVFKESEGNNFRLIIKNADLDHEGDYTCIASNEMDTCSSRAQLLVEEIPSSLRFKKPLSDAEISPNQEVELFIEVEGQPRASWFKNDVPINDT